jgi:hypothetical protein
MVRRSCFGLASVSNVSLFDEGISLDEGSMRRLISYWPPALRSARIVRPIKAAKTTQQISGQGGSPSTP